MTKQEFISELRKKLSGLPEQDVEERVNFYSELIDDMLEEGCTEDEIFLKIGSVDEIAAQIITETPLARIAKEKIKPKRRIKAWEIVLLVLGSPIWLSLGFAAIAVIFSLYVVLWSVIISLWAIFVSVAACAIGGIVASIILIIRSQFITGMALIGATLFCAGLAIFLFYGCKAAASGIIILTKKIALGIKKCFIGKGEEQ